MQGEVVGVGVGRACSFKRGDLLFTALASEALEDLTLVSGSQEAAE